MFFFFFFSRNGPCNPHIIMDSFQCFQAKPNIPLFASLPRPASGRHKQKHEFFEKRTPTYYLEIENKIFNITFNKLKTLYSVNRKLS